MEFVRVKRRHDEDPFNSIVVSHKKLKTNGSSFSTDCVFQFAATIKDENENLSQILKDVRESKSVKCLTKINRNKNTNNVVAHSKAERLKILDTLRAVKQDTVTVEEKDGENSEIKVVDFITKADDETKASIDDEGISIDYVYDVYYALNNDNKPLDIDDIDSVRELEPASYYSMYENQNHCCRSLQYEEVNDDDADSDADDNDDSNDEGNWRNDYPEEDEMINSDNDDDFESLVVPTRRWNINNYSSSDDDDFDNRDLPNDYDSRLARYKERVKAQEHYYYNNDINDSTSGSSDSND
ncbi:Transcription factor Iwr1 [Cinara cedri]|uniref:Probable RNA polymerase II nuclear localization protein SLC7A6OS n=1 Tax=Cinara cedri TaxID=506608 RepID=A0A5E4MWI5_9HEMI|nr:Transcription factor Iwr1 [Cinara cedri]